MGSFASQITAFVQSARPIVIALVAVATVASNVTIGKNAKIGPNAMLYEDVKEGEQHD